MANPLLAFENLSEYVHNNAFVDSDDSIHCTDLDYSFAGRVMIYHIYLSVIYQRYSVGGLFKQGTAAAASEIECGFNIYRRQ